MGPTSPHGQIVQDYIAQRLEQEETARVAIKTNSKPPPRGPRNATIPGLEVGFVERQDMTDLVWTMLQCS